MRTTLPLPYFTSRSGYPWFVVGTVCIGAFMAALDASIVNVALPTLTHHFRGGINRVEWVSVAYLLTLTSLLTVFGRIADMVGRRLMYSLGFAVFLVGSILCGVSPHLIYLIYARILQAAGAAMLQANSVAIVTSAVSPKQRGKAIGIQGSAQAIGLSIGPAIGGLLISHWGWPAIFYVNVPVGLFGTIAGLMILPQDYKHEKQKFDFLGAFVLTAALVLALLTLTDGNHLGWTSPAILSYSGLTVVLLGFLYFWTKRVENPIVDLSLFRIAAFTRGNVTGLLSFATMYGVLFLLPFYLETVQHRLPSETGFLLTPVPIAMAFLTPYAGTLADKFSVRILTVFGMLLSMLGTLFFVFVGTDTSVIYCVVALILLGAGQGMFTPPNNSSVMGSVPKDRLGVSGGILNMSRSFGMSFGIAFAGAIYEMTLSSLGVTTTPQVTTHLLPAFRWGFLATAALSLVAIVILLVRPKMQRVEGNV